MINYKCTPRLVVQITSNNEEVKKGNLNMKKMDVLYVLPSKNSVICLKDVRKEIEKKFKSTISRVHFKETELKIFFKPSVSLYTIDKSIELIVDVKQIRWYYTKKIGEGTSILEVLIE